MTRAKDISKILTDADLSGTLDVTGTVTAGSVAISDDNNYSFGDGTTYIQGSGAADRLKFITNASEAMRIDSSGNVGIGTSIPAKELDVVGTVQIKKSGQAINLNTPSSSQNVWMNFSDNGSAKWEIQKNTANLLNIYSYDFGSNVMTFNGSGNVGIGESNPVAKTHIQGSGTSGQTTASLILENSSSGTAGMDITGSAGSSRLRFLYGGGPSTGTNTLAEAINIVLEGSNSGNVGIGTSSPDEKLDVRGTLQVGVDGTTAGLIRFMDSGSVTEEATISSDANGGLIFGGNSGPGELIFRTGSSTERMRIDSSGNVGIGTASPNGNGLLTINAPTNNSPQIVFTENDTAKWLIGHRHDGDHFRFYDLANSAERMRISSNGHVSVGTTDNTYGFNVGGSGSDVRGKFQGSNQYRLGLQNGTNNIVWLGSGGADNFRISNASGQTRFEIDSNGVVKNTDFIIPFPAGQAPAGTFTHYNNGSQQSTDASHGNLPMSCNLKVKAMYLYVNSALSSGSATVQIIKNGVAVATINVTTGTSAFNSTGLSISFNAGDRMGIKIIGTSTSAAWYNVSVLCERA